MSELQSHLTQEDFARQLASLMQASNKQVAALVDPRVQPLAKMLVEEWKKRTTGQRNLRSMKHPQLRSWILKSESFQMYCLGANLQPAVQPQAAQKQPPWQP